MLVLQQKKSIRSLSETDLRGKRVLLRVDLNVPLVNGKVGNDMRIQSVLPTLQFLQTKGAIVIMVSHLGRPSVPFDPSFSLQPVKDYFKTVLNLPVCLLSSCVGDEVQSSLREAQSGDLFLLENIRFYPEEVANDRLFTQQLADLADIYVQDAFGVVHREHASVSGVSSLLPAYSGFLVEKELSALHRCLDQTDSPFLAIVGGSKVSSKLGVLRSLIGQVDHLVIGGAMAYTFLYVQGHGIGKSLFEVELCKDAEQLLKMAQHSSTTIHLPLDHRVVRDFSDEVSLKVTEGVEIEDNYLGVDVGPKTVSDIEDIVCDSKTILWNGPLGIFERPAYATSTMKVADLLSKSSATTIVGGGDSVAAVHQAGVADCMTHVSTGGGACLAFIEGKPLPGILPLEDQ